MSSPTSHKSYRPLCVLTFRLNYFLSGLSPRNYHLTNVIAHACVVVTFYQLLARVILQNRQLALLAALLFSVHPVHTEAVTGVVGRADVLACLWSLVCFWSYLEHCQLQRMFSNWLVLTVFTGAAAMLTKEQGITVLGVCLVYDLLVLNWSLVLKAFKWKLDFLVQEKRVLVRVLVLIVSVVLLLSFRLYMLHGQLPGFTDQDNPASFSANRSTRVMTYVYLAAFNSWLLLAPVVLCYDWQMGSIPLVESFFDPRQLASIAMVIVVLTMTWKTVNLHQGAMRRVLVFGMLFLTLPYLPASNLFFRVGFVVAERILYIPSIGYSVLAVLGLNSLIGLLSKRHRTYVGPCITVGWMLLMLLMALKTTLRNPVWWNRESLFQSGLKTVPHNAKVHYNFANFLKDSGRNEEAIFHYNTALELYPNHPSACNNLATIIPDQKEAERLYRRAVKINPQHSRAFFNLGNLLNNQHRLEEAEEALHQSLKLDPNYGDAMMSLSNVLESRGKSDLALASLERALRLYPENAGFHNNMAVQLAKMGRSEESLSAYQRAIQLQSDNTVTIVNYARQLRAMHRDSEAETMFQRALSIRREPDTLHRYAAMLFNTGQQSRAERLYREALQHEPGRLDTSLHLSNLLSGSGQAKDAILMLRQLLTAHQTNIEVHKQLISALSMHNLHEEALAAAEHAIRNNLTDGTIYSMKGNALKDLNRFTDAAESFRIAAKLQPDSANVHMNLGACLHILKRYPEARLHYETALRLEPDNQIVQDNLQKLSRLERRN